MNAAEILNAYNQGRRDFRGQSLRGCNFARLAQKLPNGQRQGVDLTGTDFSGCDIRGANFSYANLTGTKFEQAQAGLQRRWMVILWVASLLLIILASLFSALAGSLVSLAFAPSNVENQITGWVVLIAFLGFMIVAWRKNVLAGAGTFAVVVAFAVVVDFAGAIASDETVAFTRVDIIVAFFGEAIVFAVAGVFSFAGAIAFAGAGAFSFAGAIASADAGAFAGGVAGSVTFVFAGGVARSLAGSVAVILTTFSGWMGWLTLKKDDRDPWLRRIVIAFAAVGGTSFYHANLSRADFTQARLKSTNFNQATLNQTSFHSAVKLELARPGRTLLANWRTRELLINPSGGEGQDFRKADLRGANLDNANLKNANLALADLSQASFVNASLQGANLTEVNAVQSDFRQATLTGACVENWNIDSSTILDHVDCQYIYLRNQEKERRPSSGEFAPGEFAKLFAEVFDTVDLIFREGVDWRALTATLQKIQVQNEETPLEVQAIENKGDGVFVVKVHVPPGADKGKLHAELTKAYQDRIQIIEARYQAQLAAKDGQIEVYREQLDHERRQNTNMTGILNTLASKPTTIEIKQVNRDHSQEINAGRDLTIDADQSTVNLRDLDL